MTKTPKPIAVTVDARPPLGRREALQILAGAVGAGVAVPGVAAGHPMAQHLADHSLVAQADAKAAARPPARRAAAAPAPVFLDAHQMRTLRALADRIVPGASKARAAEFIDQLLAVDAQANQRAFLSALGALDARAREIGRRPWVALTAAEQEGILTDASTMASGMPAPPPWTPGSPVAAAAPSAPPRLTLRDHFEHLKGWIAGAYYSSEIGMRELGWKDNPFHLEFTGCTHEGGHA